MPIYITVKFAKGYSMFIDQTKQIEKYINNEKLRKVGCRVLYWVDVMLYWCFFAIILGLGFIYKFFGDVDLSAIPLLVAKLYGGGISFWIEAKILGGILVPALLLAVLFIKIMNKFCKNTKEGYLLWVLLFI